MLIRRQAEFSLVNLCDLPQRSLEITIGFVLYATVFDEAREMVLAILASLPAKVVNVAVESIRARGLKAEAEKLLDICSEGIKTHAVDRIFQASILPAVQVFQ